MKPTIAITAILAALAVAGHYDRQDQEAEADRYADMVCDGAWPDYKGLEPECDK